MVKVLGERDACWTNVRYDEMEIYATQGLIVQTFRVRGLDCRSGPFDSNGVDLYAVRDGRIGSKDSYWKIPGLSSAGQGFVP